MSNKSKGAIAMVLAGAVTFSVTNSFLPEPMSLIAKELSFHMSGDSRKTGLIRKQEIAVTDTNRKEAQKGASDDSARPIRKPAIQANSVSNQTGGNKATKTTTQKSSASGSMATSSQPSRPAPKASAPAKAAPSAAPPPKPASVRSPVEPVSPAPPKEPSKSAPAPKPANRAPANEPERTPNENAAAKATVKSENAATTNRGQEISQAAKDKGTANREQNGKKDN
ncbi:hypothetical protein [Bacillus sp. FJAT-27251]|uniref:hypothetical protein n=1 Tax=Bacillus sp. FJAT-27251 TaxID=1684142 RepID=UPI0006A763B7|nr:hypothetical protein [Bacillus sp. FJAT-27251]